MRIGEGPDAIQTRKTRFQPVLRPFFLGDHFKLDRKSVPILAKTFFLGGRGDHLTLDRKTDSI